MNIEAIILNSRDYRENDKMVTAYSRQLGKIEILVRSAKKITSKLAHLTSGLYALSSLVVEPGRNFYHLIGGGAKKYFKKIVSDSAKNVRTGRILNIVDKMTKLEKPDPKSFDLLIKTLEKIDDSPSGKTEILIYAFLIKLLSFLGYKPEIKKCLICHKATRDKTYFSLNQGGIICENCKNNKKINAAQIAPEILMILQNLLYQNFDSIEKIFFDNRELTTAKKIIDQFLEWHLQ